MRALSVLLGLAVLIAAAPTAVAVEDPCLRVSHYQVVLLHKFPFVRIDTDPEQEERICLESQTIT